VRLKGSGMHWAREQVNPLVALRTVACTNRWAEVWLRISTRLRTEAEQRRRSRWLAAILRPLQQLSKLNRRQARSPSRSPLHRRDVGNPLSTVDRLLSTPGNATTASLTAGEIFAPAADPSAKLSRPPCTTAGDDKMLK